MAAGDIFRHNYPILIDPEELPDTVLQKVGGVFAASNSDEIEVVLVKNPGIDPNNVNNFVMTIIARSSA